MTENTPPALSDFDGALGLEFLNFLEYALLKRTGPRSYEFCGLVPSFYKKIFTGDDGRLDNPWEHSFMLEYFLLDAEEFFERSPKPGERINSGIWLETDHSSSEEIPLIARAWQLKDEQVMSIQVIHEEYAERLRILRKARHELMERRKISTALNSFKKKALFDAMTKLYNKGSFMDILQEQVEKFRNYSPTMALFIIDVDHFKNVNDTLGHLAGDSILIQVAEVLKASLRKNDFPARYGGDEFTVIAPDTNTEQSQKLAEKLRSRIASHDFGTDKLRITISVGFTIYRPGETLQNFIRRADLALYDAKQMGRNIACFRDPWLIDDEDVIPDSRLPAKKTPPASQLGAETANERKAAEGKAAEGKADDPKNDDPAEIFDAEESPELDQDLEDCPENDADAEDKN
ncbi:MAG: GGDEF domain-containing protein [Deltaproteobacteria bacterium]|nr:GGDEF domain-containing protein [Deltaproteobacteria bacterium]